MLLAPPGPQYCTPFFRPHILRVFVLFNLHEQRESAHIKFHSFEINSITWIYNPKIKMMKFALSSFTTWMNEAYIACHNWKNTYKLDICTYSQSVAVCVYYLNFLSKQHNLIEAYKLCLFAHFYEFLSLQRLFIAYTHIHKCVVCVVVRGRKISCSACLGVFCVVEKFRQ